MAIDALAVRCLTQELKSSLLNGRIDKIHQPERDEIILHIRTLAKNYKLVLSAGSAYPRVHFTARSKSNPAAPPMFCMLLRKHIGSGKIVDVRQVDFERILIFDVESYDELGDLGTKHLIIEIMGRHSNIILTSQEGRIIDSIKHVDLTVSSVRQVLPGMPYQAPPGQDKSPLLPPSPITLNTTQGGMPLFKAVLGALSGISPLTARELVYEAYGRTDIRAEEAPDLAPLYGAISNLAEKAEKNQFAPCMLTDAATGKILDFSSIPIRQYEGLAKITAFGTLNELLDQFFSGRDAMERMKQKSADLVKLLNTHLERAAKKLIILNQTLKDAENKEQYKIQGDLITANLYRIEENAKSVEVENYYEPDCPTLKISLDPSLSPSQNAQKYYKKYQKAKNAEVEVAKQLKSNQEAIDYLDSTLLSAHNAQNESDLNAIRRELAEEGYLKRVSVKKNKQQSGTSKPMHFVSSDGFDIYVGKNNTQNDYLTLKFANSSDLWFHTKNIHGSHTIIKLGIDKDVPDQTLLEAAQLAAYYSKGRDSAQVPVDYTQVKNVKKPNGAKPGMVIYDFYNTLYVTPKTMEEK